MKTGFKRYMRTCKRCKKIYYTVAERGRVCPKCDASYGDRGYV